MAANATQQPTMASGRFIGHLSVTPTHGPVGTTVTLSGKGLPPHTRLTLIWETYDADWSIEQHDGVDWEKFYGIDFVERIETLGEVETDADGHFQTTVTVPEDYGGMHDIYAVDPDGQRLNKLGFRIDPSLEMTPDHGPVGTSIQLTMRGLNPAHPIEGWYQLYYDNRPVGCITAVTTRGTAHMEIPANGAVGPHVLSVENAAYGRPFLQLDQSPYHHLPTFHPVFEITEGEPVTPLPPAEQMQPEIDADGVPEPRGAPQIWTDLASMPARSAFTVYGRDFPPHADIELRWIDVSGDRVTEVEPGQFGTGFSDYVRQLATAQTDADGSFEVRAVHEGVQGGNHPVEAWHGEDKLSHTYVHIGRRPYPLRPKSGPVGTPIQVEIDGIGWTEHDNEVGVTYDNSYVGYGCGGDLMGKVRPHVYASGRPGIHYVDVYPTIRNAPDHVEGWAKPNFFRQPLLNWRDHPSGFHFRYTFHVTKEG